MKRITLFLFMLICSKLLQAQPACPTVNVTGPASYTVAEGKDAVFNIAPFAKEFEKSTYTYNWSISTGTITSGQGTKSIHVNTAGLKGQSLTVTVEVSGLPASCSNVSSTTIDIIEPDIKTTTKPKPKAKPAVKTKKA